VRHVTICTVIRSFKHKGLRDFFEVDDAKRLPADMLDRIGRILLVLGDANRIDELNFPTYRLHPLKGNLRGYWSVTVRANWRIVFRLEDKDVFDVDFVDYH
jgi:toxin HigB-1